LGRRDSNADEGRLSLAIARLWYKIHRQTRTGSVTIERVYGIPD
jgi:hypothetical protein